MALQTFTISTNVTHNGTAEERKTTFQYQMPESLEEATTAYTAEVIFKEFLHAMKIGLRDPARKVLAQCAPGTTQEEWDTAVRDYMTGFVFGQKRPRATPKLPQDVIGAFSAQLPTLPVERQRDILRSLHIPEDAIEAVIAANQGSNHHDSEAASGLSEHTVVPVEEDTSVRRPKRSVVA
jgi:hypothetical protein